MTKGLQVALALKALVQAALPAATVRGFDADVAKPERIGAGGCVIGDKGDPGEPDVDLSPLTYNYRHRFELAVAAANGAGGAALDTMLTAIGTAIEADRTLGSLAEWLEAEAPQPGDADAEGVAAINWASVPVIVEYSTSSPLG